MWPVFSVRVPIIMDTHPDQQNKQGFVTFTKNNMRRQWRISTRFYIFHNSNLILRLLTTISYNGAALIVCRYLRVRSSLVRASIKYPLPNHHIIYPPTRTLIMSQDSKVNYVGESIHSRLYSHCCSREFLAS